MIYYILVLVFAAGLAFIPANIAKRKGYSFGLWWLYGWMLWIVAIIHVNCIPDKNAQQTYIPQNSTVSQSGADELKKYKELLDSGAITQEEFDAKKKEILGL